MGERTIVTDDDSLKVLRYEAGFVRSAISDLRMTAVAGLPAAIDRLEEKHRVMCDTLSRIVGDRDA